MTRNQRSRLKKSLPIKVKREKKKTQTSLDLRVSKGKPQLKGLTLKIFTLTPKKPNSALRKVAKVKLSTGLGPRNQRIITAYIPGENHTLSIHNSVLIIPSRKQDLPGVKYRIIRGVLDCK